MVAKKQGGGQGEAGFYWEPQGLADVVVVPGDGGTLDGAHGERYLRIPL
jgi:hypothetical protein